MKIFFSIAFFISQFAALAQVDLAVQKAHSDEIMQLEFSKSGRYLASMADNHEFVIWDLFHEKSISSFNLSQIEVIEGMKFSDSEGVLKVKTARTTYFYDISSESFTEENDQVTKYRKKAYFLDQENNFELYLKKGTIRKRGIDKRIYNYRLVVTSQKLKFKGFAVSVKANLLVGVADNEHVYVYDYLKGSKKKELKGHYSNVNDVCFTADGKYFATAGVDRSIAIWDAQTLRIKLRLNSNVYRKKTAEFSYDGNQLYIGDELGYIYEIDFSTAFPEINVARPNYHSVNKIMKSSNDQNESFLIATSHNNVYLKKKPINEAFIERYQFRDHAILESKTLIIQELFKSYRDPFGEITELDQSPNGKSIIYTGKSDFPGITFATIATGKERRIYHHYNNKSWKDIGFTSDSTFIGIKDSSNIIYSWKVLKKNIYQKTDTLLYVLEGFEVIAPNKLWLNTKYYGQYIYDTKTRRYENVLDVHGMQTFKKSHYVVIETNSNALLFYDLETKTVGNRFTGHKGNITDVNFHPDMDKFVSSSDDGTVRLWSMNEKRQLAVIIPFKNKEFIFITGDNYYLMSKGAMKEIGFKVEGQYFYPEQFDLKYNRPDIVLEQMGFSNKNLIAAYRKAYLKRLKKMNFTEAQVRGDFHLPELEVINLNEIKNQTNQDSLRLSLAITDELSFLDRINIWVNDVAIYGVDGISIRELKKNYLEMNIAIELAEGNNKIQISVLNVTGAESYKSTVQIEKELTGNRPNLYIASIGISKHQDSRYDLSYADKDAEDLVATFTNDTYFNEVKSVTLTNEEVKMENLEQLKTFLSQAQIDDVVLVFIAGHGVLNAEFDYFFATHDMDFETPEERGVPYEAIEKLLDGIKALKKMLFMDTCHSGELDKDDIEEDTNKEEQGDLIFRNVGKTVKLKDNPLGLQNTNSLMKSLFTDLRKGTGATVISSSGGTELSIEGNNFNNGLFTYCMLNGLTTGAADLNDDDEIYISELQRYVKIEVNRLSNGLQTPTSRIQNKELDYRIW